MQSVNTGVHASFINLNDNVPFQRVYRNQKVFKASYARMKGSELKEAICFDTLKLIKPEDLH